MLIPGIGQTVRLEAYQLGKQRICDDFDRPHRRFASQVSQKLECAKVNHVQAVAETYSSGSKWLSRDP
jgi:hypothetical protein